MRAANKTAVNGTAFDASDSNTKQHWLLLTADELTAYDQYCKDKADSIEDIQYLESEIPNNDVYDLSGRKVNCHPSNVNPQLKKGIYIKDGKKILF